MSLPDGYRVQEPRKSCGNCRYRQYDDVCAGDKSDRLQWGNALWGNALKFKEWFKRNKIHVDGICPKHEDKKDA